MGEFASRAVPPRTEPTGYGGASWPIRAGGIGRAVGPVSGARQAPFGRGCNWDLTGWLTPTGPFRPSSELVRTPGEFRTRDIRISDKASISSITVCFQGFRTRFEVLSRRGRARVGSEPVRPGELARRMFRTQPLQSVNTPRHDPGSRQFAFRACFSRELLDDRRFRLLSRVRNLFARHRASSE